MWDANLKLNLFGFQLDALNEKLIKSVLSNYSGYSNKQVGINTKTTLCMKNKKDKLST